MYKTSTKQGTVLNLLLFKKRGQVQDVHLGQIGTRTGHWK